MPSRLPTLATSISETFLATFLISSALCLGGVDPRWQPWGWGLLLLSLAARWCDRETRWSPFALLLVPFLVWLAVRAPFSPAPWEAWREVETWIQAAVVVLLASSSRNPARVGWGLGLAALLVSAAAAWQWFSAPGWLPLGRVQVEQYWGRASGTFGNPNSFALFSVLSAGVLVSFALDGARSLLSRALAGWCAALITATALLSGSRGVAAALTLALLLAALRSRRWRFALGAVLLAGLVVALVPPVRERVRLAIEHRGETARAILWPITINAALQRPLTGAGGGSFPLVFEENRPAGFVDSPGHAHSEPLELWLEHGAIGLALLSLPVFGYWIQQRRSTPDRSAGKRINAQKTADSPPSSGSGPILQPSNPPNLDPGHRPPGSGPNQQDFEDTLNPPSTLPTIQPPSIKAHESGHRPQYLDKSSNLQIFQSSDLPIFRSSNLPIQIALLTFAFAITVDFHLRVPALLFTAAWLLGSALRVQVTAFRRQASGSGGIVQPSNPPILDSGQEPPGSGLEPQDSEATFDAPSRPQAFLPSTPPTITDSVDKGLGQRTQANLPNLESSNLPPPPPPVFQSSDLPILHQSSQTGKTRYLAFLKHEASPAVALTLALVAATPSAVRSSFAETERRAALDAVQGLVGATPQERERLLMSAASARARLRHAVHLSPSHARAWADLSAMELLATPPDSSLRTTAGGAAEAAARTALGLSGAPAESWVRLGNALQATGRPDAAAEAAACFQQALRRAPRSPLVWYHYAYFLASRPGSARLALSAIENCLQLDPTHRAAQHLRQRLSSFE